MAAVVQLTKNAHQAMVLAYQEAEVLNHEYLDTTHVLLGLVGQETDAAADVLRKMNVHLGTARAAVEALAPRGPAGIIVGVLPTKPDVVRLLQYAHEEAGGSYVGTVELLRGMLRGEDFAGYTVLMRLGVDPDKIRKETAPVDISEVIRMLEEEGPTD